jgi:hypothetical protein
MFGFLKNFCPPWAFSSLLCVLDFYKLNIRKNNLEINIINNDLSSEERNKLEKDKMLRF